MKAGDTAGAIAEANRPARVSLDQMLVALLNANPEAFVNGNVNRIRSGAVLDIPNAQLAMATPAQEASSMIRAQTQDFNEYRRSLAQRTPQIPAAASARSSGGNLEARVEDKQLAASTDKLTLSNAEVKGRSQEEELIAKGNQQEQGRQASELSKNIEALKKLSAEIGQSATPSEPATAAKDPGAMTQPEVSRPTSIIDKMVSTPAVLLATGLLAVLLASLAFFRVQRRSQSEAVSLEDVLRESVAPVGSGPSDLHIKESISGHQNPKSPDLLEEARPQSPVEPSLDPSEGPSTVTHADSGRSNSIEEPAYSHRGELPGSAAPQATPFDLSTINLDLDTPPSPAAPAEDAMSIKLALAEEFMALGDKEGARLLLAELMAGAKGDLYLKARSLQQQLG